MNKDVHPTMGEEFTGYLEKYRSPDIHFPEEGNEPQERLAGQIDQRLWSYMYSPGMQTFLNKVDEAIASRFSITKMYLDKKGVERNEVLRQRLESDMSAMEQKLTDTRNTLWGLGGLFVVGGGALAAYTLWPKFKAFFSTKARRPDDAQQTADGEVAVQRKNYFKWKRDRLMGESTTAKW